MTRPTVLSAFLLSSVFVACGGGPPASLDSDDQKASYAIGLDMGARLEPASSQLDVNALERGIRDALAGEEPAVPQEALQTALAQFNQAVREQQETEMAAASEANALEEESYLAENGSREGVQTTESGLQYEVLLAGDGPRPESGQRAVLHYRGTLPDGTEFDTSYDGDPVTFSVDGLIPGFSEALKLMPVGSHYRFVIPAALAYGPGGSAPAIGPNQALVFEIELQGIESGTP